MSSDRQPIFFAWTRSFWFTVAGILSMFEAGAPVLRGVATVVAPLVGMDADTLGDGLVAVAPAVLWVAALHQRRGAARPYTINPKACK